VYAQSRSQLLYISQATALRGITRTAALKAHVAIEPETGILTAIELTPANTADAAVGVELLDGEQPGLQVLADGAYGSGEALSALTRAGHSLAIKPRPLPSAVPGGLTGTTSPSAPKPPPSPARLARP
jgi:hypothetical protein